MTDIWNLMKKYRFDIVNDFNNNILCTTCNGLLINAHSSPCGCVYCFDCIKEYLDGMEKVCPGQSDECKKEIIIINKNMFPDNITNKNVLGTIVKCPEKNCEFKDELKNIGDHIRVCDYRSVECPYIIIGCKNVEVRNVDLKEHLIHKIVDHSKLMLESVDHLRNEMKFLKENVTVLTMENKDLKKEIIDLKEETVSKVKDLDSRIDNQDEEIKEMKEKFTEREMKCDQHCETVIERINVIEKVNIDLRIKVDKNKESILLVKDEMKQIETNSMKESESMKSDILLNKNFVESIKKMFEEEKEKIKDLQCCEEMMENNREADKKLLLDTIDEISNINNDLKLRLDKNEKLIAKIDDNNQRNIDQLRKETTTMRQDEMENKVKKMVESVKKMFEEEKAKMKMLQCNKENIEENRERDKKLLSDKIDAISKINNDLKLRLDFNKKSIENIDNNNQRNIDQLRKEMATLRQDEMTNKNSIKELERKCERQNVELKESKEKIEMRRKEMEKEKERTDKIDKSISNIDEKLNVIDKNLTPQIGGEFVWRIDKWKEKSERAQSAIDEIVYSDPFYSHKTGYKMCLRVHPIGTGGGKGTDLSVFFHLMRGEFDDILLWPFKCDVTFELIDQRTKKFHTKVTVKYKDYKNNSSYQKPTEERNTFGLGYHNFVSLSDLSNEKIGLCENDQLFIRCRVTII